MITEIVPCNGCTLCCHNDCVRLLPSDNAKNYQTESHPYFDGSSMLAHKANGDCVYLDKQGCTIHDSKPFMCKTMDCRNLARMFTFTQARKLDKQGKLRVEVFNKGRELLKQQ